jgi:hypothetical protein
VGLVEVEGAAIGEVSSHLGGVAEVAVHGEQRLRDPPGERTRMWCVAVAEDVDRGAGQAEAVDQAGVVEGVAEDAVVRFDQRRQDADV